MSWKNIFVTWNHLIIGQKYKADYHATAYHVTPTEVRPLSGGMISISGRFLNLGSRFECTGNANFDSGHLFEVIGNV